MMKYVFHFHTRLLDAYRLRQKRRIPALCATYSHMSDEKFLGQNVGLGSSTQAHHGRRSVGDEGDADQPAALGDQHKKCPHTFSVHKTNIYIGIYSETDHSPLLKTVHRSSSKINNTK